MSFAYFGGPGAPGAHFGGPGAHSGDPGVHCKDFWDCCDFWGAPAAKKSVNFETILDIVLTFCSIIF